MTIVPEDFDLHSALHSESSTPPEERTRCPECKHSSIYPITHKSNGVVRPDAEYRCEDCGHAFDQPIRGVRRVR